MNSMEFFKLLSNFRHSSPFECAELMFWITADGRRLTQMWSALANMSVFEQEVTKEAKMAQALCVASPDPFY